MDFYYNILTDTFISSEVMKRTRRIANYISKYLENTPYQQVYLERYCQEEGKEICINEPVYGLVLIHFEGDSSEYTEPEYKEFIRQYIKEHGYVYDRRRIIDGSPDETLCYESLQHRYETNNWLKTHHLPMRRKVPRKYQSKTIPNCSLHTFPIGCMGTGMTRYFLRPQLEE